MPDFPIAIHAARGLALARASEAMLRAMGGADAVFRLPANVADSENTISRELGLQPALTENFIVAPALVRRRAGGIEVLVSPKSLEPHLHSRGFTAGQFFESTSSILAAGETFRMSTYEAEVLADTVYLYRITVTK